MTDAGALHADALVIDVHTHGVGFLPRVVARAYRAATRGSMPADVALSELSACGVDAVVAKAVGDPVVTAFRKPTAAAKAVLDQLEGIRVQAAAGGLPVVTDVGQLDAARAAGTPAVILGVEGADPLAGHPERAATWAAAGVRVVGLVHYVDNGLGTVQLPWYEWVPVPLPVRKRPAPGLTAAGAEAVDALVAAGILVDLAHADAATTMATCERVGALGKPVISSHSGATAVREFARFHGDDELRAIAGTGGLVGLWPFCYRGEGVADLDEWCRHADHLVGLLGVEHVGIGTDMNGVSGLMDGYRGEHDLVKLTGALLDKVGLAEPEARAVLGGNARRVLEAAGVTSLPTDPDWFKQAVFYEVLVRGFYDSDGDGTGDLRGLTEKLDYLEWLGVDCLWLLPFYESPLRDGGYDISDFFSVLPAYGDVEAAAHLIEEAHRRGMRVIADMVMNHTSDAHPWFQESRSSPENPKADWYVWNDDDQRWGEARIIFVDTEPSNWTYDAQRGQYYWHRFFHHQPDLNYDNPEVADAMLDVVRFWLDLGLDGFRLDAVPYLFERDGTNGENLKETHEYLRRVRKAVEDEFPGRILLAEANQWPADVVDYFGDGDECHMCFHFPLMPRMFMSVRREQRYPITEILAQTPAIPDGCQWGIFLRNHDELTLEMVNDEERDYMYAEYAKDPLMKRNVGISRRLFPLLENDRNVVELFHAMLFSMPGSPVLYYGDEIGMGDNIYLGDRDGVRTPMQWTPDRNGGFSRADFAQLYLPPLMDPVYGFQATNVEAEQRDPSSFLHWMRRMLEVRKQHPVLGMGTFEVLEVENPSVLAYLRRGLDLDLDGQEDIVLCVHNLSRFAQPAELQLGALAGKQPIELMGRVPFPLVGELPYFVTLPGHGFFWFSLVDGPEER